MDSSNDYNNESISLPCHASCSSSIVAPPPSPLHEVGDEKQEKMRRGCSKRESLADELSHSLATIAREERRKVQYGKGNASAAEQEERQSSDGAGDASEESWLTFLGTEHSGPGPPLVTATATTNSSSEERYSSNDGKQASSNNDSSDGHGLPKPVNDRVGTHHDNAHASVIASLPPPQFKSSGSGSSSSVRSSSSCEKSKSGDERAVDGKEDNKKKRAPPRPKEISKLDSIMMKTLPPKPKKRRVVHTPTDYDDDADEEYSSSSGSEGGYDASSSDNRMEPRSSSPSPSVSSSETEQERPRRKQFIGPKYHAKRSSKRGRSVGSSGSSSSELADFGSSSASPSRSSDGGSSDFAKAAKRTSHSHAKKRSREVAFAPQAALAIPTVGESLVTSNKIMKATMRRHQTTPSPTRGLKTSSIPRRRLKSEHPVCQQTPIFSLGCDMMAHVMSYLEPTEVHSLLTVPLSKQWRDTYTVPQDLWRILCLMEPFKAKFGPEDLDESSDDSLDAIHSDPELKETFGKYRLLFTSFIRCLRYLTQIKDDAIHGRPSPSVLDYGGGGGERAAFQLTSNSGLRNFLAKARVAVGNNRHRIISSSSQAREANAHVELSDDDRSVESEPMPKKQKKEAATGNGVRYGHSKLTQRLLGPSKTGAPGNVELPWSCAIYSIVNWMAAFSDVEGIQTMCLKVLPFLLEDEGQRTTAQNAGLTDIVLRAMVVFPDSAELHTAAFHTIVLLARPLGGREGMLFHSSMVNSSGIFNNGSKNGKSGIAVMLDSMERFEAEDILQAMSCWSLVNIALAPSQKSVLVKLGGIQATTNAMIQHPYNAEVQFRALFALINLVIPSVPPPDESNEGRAMQEQLGEMNQTVEKDVLDESVGQICNLVVTAMKHFCSSESILNRACLVLHNLSLSPDYHTTLLWTKGCYQMLEWCLANYRTDQVLQQSAAGTLHRLQQTMSNNEELRQQFTSFLQSQQQQSLEQAHREAMLLQEQAEESLRSSALANDTTT